MNLMVYTHAPLENMSVLGAGEMAIPLRARIDRLLYGRYKKIWPAYRIALCWMVHAACGTGVSRVHQRPAGHRRRCSGARHRDEAAPSSRAALTQVYKYSTAVAVAVD